MFNSYFKKRLIVKSAHDPVSQFVPGHNWYFRFYVSHWVSAWVFIYCINSCSQYYCGTYAGVNTTLCMLSDCATTCGTNSICSGLPTSPPTFTCSCQTGFVSPSGNGKNCIANCTSNVACGSNSYCDTATGVCACNMGYYSPNANGINCIAPTASCELITLQSVC